MSQASSSVLKTTYGLESRNSPLVSLCSSAPQLSTLSETNQKVLNLLKADPFFKNEAPLKTALSGLDSTNLQLVLDAFVQELSQEGLYKDCLAIIQRLAEVLPADTIQEAVRAKMPGCEDALVSAKEMLESSEYYLKSTQGDGFSWSATFASIIETLIAILESVLNAFGIADFFRTAENPFHSDIKFQKIMMLVTLFSLLSAILLPVLGPAIGAAVVGGTFVFIAVLSLIYPYIRPTPVNLTPSWECLNKAVRESSLSTIGGRIDGAEAIAKALIDRKKSSVRTTPIVLGDTGVGKTQTMKLFVKRLDAGCYPELSGMKVHCASGATLANNQEMFGGGNKEIARTSEAMGYNRKETILVIDEAHEIFVEREQSNVAGQLKTKLDGGLENFPFVVLLTTQKEYEQHILNSTAMNDRFQPIHIKSMNEQDTIEVLTDFVLRKAPSAIVDADALKRLWDLTQTQAVAGEATGAQQPGSVLRVMTQCIQHTTETQKTAYEVELEEKRRALNALHAQGALQGEFDATHQRAIKDLEAACDKLEKAIAENNKQRTVLFNTKEMLAQVKTAMHQLTVDVAPLDGNKLSKANKAQLGTLLMLKNFLAPALDRHIRTQAAALNVKAVIDIALVDEVVKAEKENKQKARDALTKVKAAALPPQPQAQTPVLPQAQVGATAAMSPSATSVKAQTADERALLAAQG